MTLLQLESMPENLLMDIHAKYLVVSIDPESLSKATQ